ncbi:hypothetical protein EW146_g4439 [Bondarzewia mesenterica]|uniref:Uncharacterized protein n=1 Tax=Bondarzewia mesenterica TaxID=1095465 RepID=A0A4S4LVN5_9AGAM|nr:hypothetical protein EW146_g4439 [Bondarzewia mesenterica]
MDVFELLHAFHTLSQKLLRVDHPGICRIFKASTLATCSFNVADDEDEDIKMLAITTTSQLTIVDPSTLRRPPPSIQPSTELSSPPTAGTWSPDGSALFIASSSTITRYDNSGAFVKIVYEQSSDGPFANLVAKDKGSLIFSAGSSVHVLEHSSSATASSRVVQTLPPHPNASSVAALSLSNDNTLLAVASTASVLVHNLSLNSHTTLRGLPLSDGQVISSCAFHQHSRVRLFLGIGKQLVVYDITRPSGPTRTIPMNDSASGHIVSIACSPYSKTLLAVACSGGQVGVVDLDKDQGRIRTFNYKVPVTFLVFSADGATLYIGTENGKLLVQTLRAMDAPKTIVMSEHGQRVIGLAISKKSKLADSATKSAGATASKPLAQQDVNSLRRSSNKPTTTDVKLPRSHSVTSSTRPSVQTRVVSTTSPVGKSTPIRKRVSSTTAAMAKKAFSPVRNLFPTGSDEVDNISVNIESLAPMARGPRNATQKTNENLNKEPEKTSNTTVAPPPQGKPPSRVSATRFRPAVAQDAMVSASAPTGRAGDKPPPRTRTVSMTARPTAATTSPIRTSSRTRTISSPKSPSSLAIKSPARSRADSTSAPVSTRMRTLSTTSRTTSATGSGSASSSPQQKRLKSGTTSVVSFAGSSASARTASGSSGWERHSRTASGVPRTSVKRSGSPIPPVPSLPVNVHAQARRVSGPSARNSISERIGRKKMAMLGIGTPEVERWIQAGKGKRKERGQDDGKRVGFVDSDDEGELNASKVEAMDDDDVEEELSAEEQRLKRSLSMQITPRRPGGSVVPSPPRHSVLGGSPGAATGAQGLLHALIKDAMVDFRQETKAEMVGLHLDLLRMGRSWRQEMRTMMDEYVGDLKELREENRRLREENQRLRRGY